MQVIDSFQILIERAEVPAKQYDCMRLHIDADQSYINLAGTGGRHRMEMGSNVANGLEVRQRFGIQESAHDEFLFTSTCGTAFVITMTA